MPALTRNLCLDPEGGRNELHGFFCDCFGFEKGRAKNFTVSDMLVHLLKQWRRSLDSGEAAITLAEKMPDAEKQPVIHALTILISDGGRGGVPLEALAQKPGSVFRPASGSSSIGYTTIRGDLLANALQRLCHDIRDKERDAVPRLPDQPEPQREMRHRFQSKPRITEEEVRRMVCEALHIDAAQHEHESAYRILLDARRKKELKSAEVSPCAVAYYQSKSGMESISSSAAETSLRTGNYTQSVVDYTVCLAELVHQFKPSRILTAKEAAPLLAQKLNMPCREGLLLSEVIHDFMTQHKLTARQVAELWRAHPQGSIIERYHPHLEAYLANALKGEVVATIDLVRRLRINTIDTLGDALSHAVELERQGVLPPLPVRAVAQDASARGLA